MDAVTAVTRDHHEIRELLAGLAGADTEYFLAQLRLRLAAHGAATEAHVYVELLHRRPGSSEIVTAHYGGHCALETQLDGVERTRGSGDFPAALARLRDDVAAELDHEEATVLPLLRRTFTAEWLREAGNRFETRRLSELDSRTPNDGASGPSQEPTG